MNTPAAPRRTLILGASALLAGCANANPQFPPVPAIPLNRQALASVHRIEVPAVTPPGRPVIRVTDPYSRKFGILGLIASDSAGDTRADELATLLATQGFRPADALQAALVQRLAARGFTPAPQADATLTATITQYGFLATGDANNQPFSPSVILAVQLSTTRDATVLFRNTVTVNGGGGRTFATFVDIENSPAAAAASLRQAFNAAADNVAASLA